MNATYPGKTLRTMWWLPVVIVAATVGGARVGARQGGPPPAPLSLTATVAGMGVSFHWTASPGLPAADGYQLQAGSAPGLSNIAVALLPASPTTFAASAPPGTYYVRVAGVNAAGVGAPSNEVVVTIQGAACTPPATPTGLQATPSAGGVTLAWNAPTTGGAPTSYRLDAGSGPGASNVGSFLLPPATSVSAPAPPGQYFVRLSAINACGASPVSSDVSFVIAGQSTNFIGTWAGTMANHTRTGLGRGPISSFQLTLNQNPPANGAVALSGRWTDNAGCTNTRIFGITTAGSVRLSVESLSCNDGDMILTVTSHTGNVIEGRCNGGANCTFRMTRR